MRLLGLYVFAFVTPAALGSPCPHYIMMADRRPTAFALDLLSGGPFGYAPMGPPGYDDGLMGLLCRMTTFPIGPN